MAVQYSPAQDRVRAILTDYLIQGGDFGWNCGERSEDSRAAIYILGGSRESLERKFVVAAKLYRDQVGGKVLLLREPGIMDYSPALKKNQSYDEWVTGELNKLGVRTQDIEPRSIPSEFFGTLSEARSIPGIVAGQGYSRLALVTSPYHARRTGESFSPYAEQHNLELCVFLSDEDMSLQDCIQEFVKLIIYEMFLV